MADSWSSRYGRARGLPASVRREVLARDPWCYVDDCDLLAVDVDHVMPYVECVRRGVDPDALDNLAGICRPHHEAKTRAEQRAGRARRTMKRQPEDHPGLIRRRA